MTAPDGQGVAREPRRYPRAALRMAYAVEAVLDRVLRGKAWYRRTLERRLRITRQDVWLARLDEAFDGYTIAHLSDFHAGPFFDAAMLRGILERLAAHRPDLVALTGDFITHRVEEGLALSPAFAFLTPPDGAFGVFGNHDYRERREGEMAAAFEQSGVIMLRNRGVLVRRRGAGLWLAGVEDVEEGKHPDLDAALRARPAGTPAILLSHHPDAVEAASRRDVDLVLAGHTHGGQVVLFGRGLLGNATRSRYRQGLYRFGATQVYVTRGIGVLIAPIRLGADPEVSLLRLRAGDAPDGPPR